MHEPLPREMRMEDRRIGAFGLVWACALIVIMAIAFVGIAISLTELTSRSDTAAGASSLAFASTNSAGRYGASSRSELFSGMPLP